MIKKRGAAASAVFAVLLTGCGGGGSDDTVVSANPPAPSPVPAPSPAASAPAATARPIVVVAPPVVGEAISVTPVADTVSVNPNPTPAPAPVAAVPIAGVPTPAPNPTPPAPPPEPGPGTYVLGNVVKAALRSNPNNLGNCNQQYYYYSYNTACDTTAYEAVGGKADRSKQGIHVGFWTGATYLSHYSYPTNYDYGNPNPKYPHASTSFQIVYPQNIFALGRTVTTYSNNAEKALVRTQGDFEIRDDHKFILNISAATWNGVDGEPYFLQLQVSTFSPSSTVFKVCMHQYFPGVRRLACTLHDKDSGAYKGTQVLDDSRQLGSTEYLPLNE